MNGHPIETAPKDGTELMLWHQTWRKPIRGYWDGSHGEWSASEKIMTLGGEVIADPSHWLPLAPTTKGTEP